MLKFLALFLALSPKAFAYEWTTRELVPSAFELPAGQTRKVPLNGNYHVKNLIVQARAAGREGGMFEVVVNGDVKGSVYVPGVDPSYVITVGEATGSLEFISRSGGAVRVEKILGVVSTSSTTARPLPDVMSVMLPKNEITDLSRQAIHSAEGLMDLTSADNRDKYVVPIKVAAGRLFAVASSRGMASGKTGQAIQTLITQFDFAQAFFDKTLTCKECFENVVNLIAVRERLERALQ